MRALMHIATFLLVLMTVVAIIVLISEWDYIHCTGPINDLICN